MCIKSISYVSGAHLHASTPGIRAEGDCKDVLKLTRESTAGTMEELAIGQLVSMSLDKNDVIIIPRES